MRDPKRMPAIELLAASENVTRTLIHEVLDQIADTAVERSMKWSLTDEAMRHLQSIRANLHSGADVTAALVDFWLAVAPQSDTRLLMVRVNDDDYATLEEQGKALGVTAEGFATLLAQQSAKDRRAAVAQAKEMSKRKMLIVANTQQQADQFIMRNAERLTGWSITVHPHAGTNTAQHAGSTFDLVVNIADNISERVQRDLTLLTLGGEAARVVTAPSGPEDRFSPKEALGA